jgi:TatD DNase family protein
MFFDTHSHLYFEQNKLDHTGIIERMRFHHVKSVQIGCRPESAVEAIALSRAYPDLFRASVGYHPSDVQDDITLTQTQHDEIFSQLVELIELNRDIVVAIGECGLDYHSLTPGKEIEQKILQKIWLKKQWELAQRYHIPLIIHSRDAREDTLDSIRSI